MAKKFNCDKCENGRITRYLHVDNGFCYKCNGTGKLLYDPTPKGNIEIDECLEKEYEEIKAEQEMIAKAEQENWKCANNIEPDYWGG